MQLHPDPQAGHASQLNSACAEAVETVFHPDSDFYRDIAEHSEALLCVHDLQGRLLWMNPAPARVLGYSAEEMLQIPMRQFVAPEFLHHFDVYLTRIAREGQAEGLLAVITRSGERRIWQYHNTLRTQGVESPIVRGTAHDVTSKMRVDEPLHGFGESLVARASENERFIGELKLFRSLVDQSNDAIEVVDPTNLRLLDVNQKSCSDLGYTREELLAMSVFDIDPKVTAASAADALAELRKSGSLVMESQHRRKDGISFPVEVSLRLVHLDREYVVVIVHDLTHRKLAESRLYASQERYRAVHDCSPVGICWVESRTGRFLGVNPKYCEILGRTEQDLLQRDFQSVTHAHDLPENLEKLRQMLTGEVRHYRLEKRYLRSDGSVRWVEVEVVAMWPEGADPLWHMAIVQDVTERKQAETKFRGLLEAAPDAMIVMSQNGDIVLVNAQTEKLFGFRRDELLNRPVEMLMPERFRSEHSLHRLEFSVHSRVGVMGAELDLYGLRKDGTEFPLEISLTPLETEQGVLISSAIRDLTDSKRAELSLRKSEAELRQAQRIARMGSWYRDLRTEEITWSEQMYTALGVDPKQRPPSFAESGRFFKPESWEKAVAATERMVRSGVPDQLEVEFYRPDGTSGWAAMHRELDHDESGAVIGVRGIAIDITERKRAEQGLRRSEENYRNFVAQSSEGIFREDMDAPVPIDLPEDELVRHVLHDSYVAECNDALARMYGLTSSAELVGKRLTEMLPPDDPRNIELTRDYIRSGFRILERESHEIDIHGNPKVFLNSMIGTVEGGMLVRTWGIQRDVTEKVKLEESRRRVENALRESEARERAKSKEMETVLDTVPVPVFLAQDVECRRISTNRAGSRMLMLPHGSNVSKTAVPSERPTYRILRDGVEVPGAELPMQSAAQSGIPVYETPLTIAFEDGTELHTLFNAVPILNAAGISTGVIGASIDITERKLAEEALRQSEQRFRVALSGSPIKVFNQDCNLRYTWVYNLPPGWRAQDYLGKTDEEVFDPETAARMAAMKRAVLESGKGTRQEFFLNHRGHTSYCDVTIEPLLDASGKVIGLNCACVDITHLRAITDELRQAKEKLSEEKLYLEKAIGAELGFGEIVGRSGALKDVMDQVAKVAPSNATVLLLGETGTGKELVARAVHQMSQRKDASFIKMNCAAIPSGLLESELFGHEKGAFTGAIAKKLGRLELADHGTLFLDEIGEIPLELQPKLLRVLQDQEFERLGATQTLKVDFRLIAATNRDLLANVTQNKFRSDLYYRLNVFPVRVPSLRDRREDIPLLVEHFVQRYATRMNKSITSIPSKTMEALVQWSWPGNIRELENFVERSVILTPGMVLQVPLVELHGEPADDKKETLREVERERITRALRECNGQLGGPNGAAARLGLKRTTLQSKLTLFGISPSDYRA